MSVDERTFAGDGRPDPNDSQAIIDVAQQAVEPTQLNENAVYSRIVPAGAAGEILDLEKHLSQPRRVRGLVVTQTVDDFTKYVERHDDTATTTVWVDMDSHQIVAVLNDHRVIPEGGVLDGRAEWGDHRARLQLKTTDEWNHWLSQDGRLLSQEDFAEHIEDGLPEIVNPDGATMLEVAQSIQGTVKADFKSAHRLANGAVGIEYVEEQTAAAGQKGELEIPERFELGIAPFLGEDPYRVKARLRYRIRAGALTIGYRLERPGDVIRDAIDQIADRLNGRFTGDRVFIGTPRSPER